MECLIVQILSQFANFHVQTISLSASYKTCYSSLTLFGGLLLISWSFPLKLAVGPVFLVIQTLPSLDNVISNQTYLSNLIDPQVLGLLISGDLALHSTSVYFLWIIPEVSSTESALSPKLKCKHSTLESKFPILISSLFK